MPKTPKLKALKPKATKLRMLKPRRNLTAEAQMERLGRDLENIELMNDWGRRDSLKARRDLETVTQQAPLPRLKKQAQMR